MIDASVIVTALRKQLNSSATIVSEGITVEQGEYVNFDPDRCPWVGCYKSKISYAPLSLGRHSTSWDATVELKIVIQASGLATRRWWWTQWGLTLLLAAM